MEVIIVGTLTALWFAFGIWRSTGFAMPKSRALQPPSPQAFGPVGPCENLDSVKCLVRHLDPAKDAELIRAIVEATVTASLPAEVKQYLRDGKGTAA